MAFDTALTNVIEQLSIIDPVQPGTITNPMVAGSTLTSSTCLDLTNHHFYRIHNSIHGTVPLNAWVLPLNRDSGVHLFTLLGQWAGRRLVVDRECRKFVTLWQYGMQCLDYCTAADEIIKGLVVRRMERAKAKREAS
ncbi:hypothetical protein BGZ57DRAFT_920175 [Hyaloscypha finlandica]|nr:hypothetical protein BGZ57DRAFT_920175 [Hyaloscypha finlandica]